ncbi:fibronectin type III domain-containing protein [Arthrobacter sp. B0490]|uniref:rhamnogalacturonan lyase family protein n=1 Tax=Arthrobacter sp. B0490 TaxID=2058891 RepID=UPI0027D26D97|nr:fibronectin type III domain-containing protein [Arthrobacter sp. B0490]
MPPSGLKRALFRSPLLAGVTVLGVSLAGTPALAVDPPPPPAAAEAASSLPVPTNVRLARLTDSAVMLRWNEVPGATGYVVSRSDTVDGDYVQVAETSGDVFATDAAVDTSSPRFYRVSTRGADGITAPSAATASSPFGNPPPLPDGGVSLDLGPGAVAPGATAITATTGYGPGTRAGFVDPSKVTGTDRGTADATRSDFVTIGDTELVVDLPNGDYTVGVIAGDAAGPTDVALIAEQITKVQPTTRPAGQYLEMSFDIAVVDGQLNLDLAGTAANLNALTITRQADRAQAPSPTVWLTGDSTVQTYRSDVAPQAGWGQMIDRFIADDVTVDNRAIGGRSSKNFISQGRLDEVLRGIRPGDYLFVQFGHNDNSYGVDDRFAAPADYYEYLRTYVDGAEQRGATPILVTPVSRRAFGPDGKAAVSFPAYVEAVQKLAAETGTPLVDLAASSRGYLDEIGAETAKSVYLHVPAGVYPSRPTGTVDDTHFQEYGAIQMARLVAGGVAGLDIPLAAEIEEAEPPAAVPAAPAGVVVASVSNASAQLTWKAVEGADIYRVFRKDAGAGDAYTLVATSTLPQATVPGLEEGAEYDVRVVAVNGRGESAPSDAVRIATKSPLYRFDVQLAGSPVMPGYTEANQTSAYTVQRGWGFLSTTGLTGRDRGIAFTPPPTDLERDFLLPTPAHEFAVDVPNGSYAVRTYTGDWIGSSRSNVQLEGKDFGSANAGRAAVAQKTSEPVLVTDGQLNLVMTGTSSRLNGIEVTPLQLAPSALTLQDLTIDGTGVAVSLAWQAADGAAGYRVYRTATGSPERIAVGDTTVPVLTDTTADVGLEYTYTVVALTAGGTESVASDPLVLTTVDPDVALAAVPTGLSLGAVNKNDVTIGWTPSDGALFYQVYRAEPKPDGSLGDAELVGRADGASFTDTEVLTTIEYTYSVAAVNAGGASERSSTITSPAATTLQRQAERLDRAPVAVQGQGGVYLGWRMLGLDEDGIAFHVYRDGERVTEAPLSSSTNLLDAEGTGGSVYRVSSVADGVERWATEDFTVWDQQYLDVPLEKPADAVTKDGQPYSYRASDASVGDVDGDGDYEIILKWDPSNSRDNSQAGYTGTVYVDAYEMDGTRLWRIDLGKNIRAGAHYTQFQVFDLDGDGRAEVTMKTADGTVDGPGTVIGDAAADHRNSSGYVLSGPEYLTVFDGATGAAIDTIDYVPARGDVGVWGDTYGNRVDRFLAGVAYLDGEKPSVVFSRGYYTRAVIAAFDFDGTNLTSRWTFDSDEDGSQYRGQGNHEFSVADVDGDQKDEIVFGSMTIDDDGEALHTTGLGHGDALHVSDFDPTNAGLEVFAAHEDMGASGNRGATFRDAATGEIIWSIPAARDTGRAAMADIDPDHPGAEGWAIGGDAAYNSPVGQLRSSAGELLSEKIPAANFVTWWDGDLLREITDNDYDAASAAGVPTVSKWNPQSQAAEEIYRAEGTLSNNTTKANPALQADLFGDWREEIVTRTEDSSALRIATTVDPTDHRLRTLQSDPVYRLGVAWQNTAYNQPPHTSYFLGQDMQAPAAPSIAYTGADAGPGDLVDPEPAFVPGPATDRDLKPSSRIDLGLADQKVGRGARDVTLENLEAGEWFYAYLDDTGLGWRQASADGEITVTTPAGTRPGNNRMVVLTADGTLLGWEALRVTGP